MGSFPFAGRLGNLEIRFYFLSPALAGWRYTVGESRIYTLHVRGAVPGFSVHLVFYGDDDPLGLDA